MERLLDLRRLSAVDMNTGHWPWIEAALTFIGLWVAAVWSHGGVNGKLALEPVRALIALPVIDAAVLCAGVLVGLLWSLLVVDARVQHLRVVSPSLMWIGAFLAPIALIALSEVVQALVGDRINVFLGARTDGESWAWWGFIVEVVVLIAFVGASVVVTGAFLVGCAWLFVIWFVSMRLGLVYHFGAARVDHRMTLCGSVAANAFSLVTSAGLLSGAAGSLLHDAGLSEALRESAAPAEASAVALLAPIGALIIACNRFKHARERQATSGAADEPVGEPVLP